MEVAEMKRAFHLILIFSLLLTWSALMAQSSQEADPLRKEIEALKKGQAAIQKDLAEIKRLIQSMGRGRQPALREAVLDLKGQPFKGAASAELVMVEFSDYQ